MREIKYLSQLDHDNIVRIRQVIDAKRKSISRLTVFCSERQEQVSRKFLPAL